MAYASSASFAAISLSMIEIANILIDETKVSAVISHPDKREVRVILDNGKELIFDGPEASEAWKAFDNEGRKFKEPHS